jgi:glycosyltransferase involved in cell wall biosynthesis
MASGLPSVSCHAVGVVDCLRDGENGLLVQPGDVGALAAALRRIIEDAALRRRLGATALEECRRTYSWGAVGRQIMDVYAAVQGRRPARVDPVLPRDPECRFRQAPHLL